MTGILYIDPATWTKDVDDYFIYGEGYWAKVAGATAELNFTAEVGIYDLIMRVRTGGGSGPTEYLSAYKLDLDGVVIPFALDTTKPNEKRDEFGGSNIGYIKAKLDIKTAGKHVFKFISTKLYGAFDFIDVLDPVGGISQTKYDSDVKASYEKGLKEGALGKFTQVQVDSMIAEARKVATSAIQELTKAQADLKATQDQQSILLTEAIKKAKEEVNAVWAARIQPLASIKTAADGIKAVIDAVIVL